MRAVKTLFTAEELLLLPTLDRRLELVEGKLCEMPPAGTRHGSVSMRIGAMLNNYVVANRLGQVFAAETGFILRRGPDTVRAPDASFVSGDRVSEEGLSAGYFEGPPDLAVEVLSPDDRPRNVREKVADWLESGTRMVWVIDPGTRSAAVYRSLEEVRELSEHDSLDGGPVIPGFTCPISDLFS
jgi:Uma2 family endonuclease